MRSMAGGESTPWVAQAKTARAPCALTAWAAAQSVPAVSIMSSTMMASRPLHVADDVHDLADVGRRPPLVDDGQAGAEALGVGARALDAAGVGRDDDRLLREAQRAGRPSAPACAYR